jgi:hypothetical protein
MSEGKFEWDSADEPTTDESVHGCMAHGAVLLVASVAAVILMALVTFACWALYRLLG